MKKLSEKTDKNEEKDLKCKFEIDREYNNKFLLKINFPKL